MVKPIRWHVKNMLPADAMHSPFVGDAICGIANTNLRKNKGSTLQLIVIGASGFIGNYLFKLAKSRGWRVWGTTTEPGNQEMLYFDMHRMTIDQFLCQIQTDPNEPAWAVNCAAMAKIETCARDRQQSYRINVEKTKELMAALIKRDIRPVHLSSDYVFDGQKGNYSETHPVCPINEYGRQKAQIETWLAAACPMALTLRLSVVVGNLDDNCHLFSHWHRALQNGRRIRCIATQKFSPTDVQDVAKGIVLSIENNLKGLYNLANPQPYARDELAQSFVKASGYDDHVVASIDQKDFGFLEKRPLKTWLDSSAFQKMTGMVFFSMDQIIEAFIKGVHERIA
jgi:dTDP-4-dehydrorhamnose reductase